MTKTRRFKGAHRLRVLGAAGLLAVVFGIGMGTALAENEGDTKLDDSAKKVGNNFGELLKGMGQELKKVVGSEDKTADKDKKKEADHADDKSSNSKENK
jgi:hypothetical protein